MHIRIPFERPELAGIKLTGKATKEDYLAITPYLEDKIANYGKIDLYWELDDFHGWDMGSLWEEVKFDFKHANHFRKVAVVGDAKWEEWLTNLAKPFTSAEVKYFELNQKEEAMNWLAGSYKPV